MEIFCRDDAKLSLFRFPTTINFTDIKLISSIKSTAVFIAFSHPPADNGNSEKEAKTSSPQQGES